MVRARINLHESDKIAQIWRRKHFLEEQIDNNL